MITVGQLYIAIGVLIAVFFMFFLAIVGEEKKRAYKRGQIDAMNNKSKIKLVEFPDGERIYCYEKELKDLTVNHIVIK